MCFNWSKLYLSHVYNVHVEIMCVADREFVVGSDKDDVAKQSCSSGGEELRHPQLCHWPSSSALWHSLPVKVNFCSAHSSVLGAGKQIAKWKLFWDRSRAKWTARSVKDKPPHPLSLHWVKVDLFCLQAVKPIIFAPQGLPSHLPAVLFMTCMLSFWSEFDNLLGRSQRRERCMQTGAASPTNFRWV